MGDDDAPYLLTNAELETADRFAGLETVFDTVTRGYPTRLGLAPGARCLEVGAGSGSIARWMADQVGSPGRVRAVDLDPRWCRREGRAQLEVRALDLVANALRTLRAHGLEDTGARPMAIRKPVIADLLDRVPLADAQPVSESFSITTRR